MIIQPTSPYTLGSCHVPYLWKHLPSEFKDFIHAVMVLFNSSVKEQFPLILQILA